MDWLDDIAHPESDPEDMSQAHALLMAMRCNELAEACSQESVASNADPSSCSFVTPTTTQDYNSSLAMVEPAPLRTPPSLERLARRVQSESQLMAIAAEEVSPAISKSSSTANISTLQPPTPDILRTTHVEKPGVLRKIEESVVNLLERLVSGNMPMLSLLQCDQLTDFRTNRINGQLELLATANRYECSLTKKRAVVYWQVLSRIHSLVEQGSYRSIRDIYYGNVELFESQVCVNAAVDDISRCFAVPRQSLHVFAAPKGLVSGRFGN